MMRDGLCAIYPGAHEEEGEIWLLDSKPLWQQTIKAATKLASQSEAFRRALRSHPSVQQWLADKRDGSLGQNQVKELDPLLAVLAG